MAGTGRAAAAYAGVEVAKLRLLQGLDRPAPAKSNDIAELRHEISTLRDDLTSGRPTTTDR